MPFLLFAPIHGYILSYPICLSCHSKFWILAFKNLPTSQNFRPINLPNSLQVYDNKMILRSMHLSKNTRVPESSTLPPNTHKTVAWQMGWGDLQQVPQVALDWPKPKQWRKIRENWLNSLERNMAAELLFWSIRIKCALKGMTRSYT